MSNLLLGWLAGLAATLFVGPAAAQAPVEADEIVVERPGPALWRIPGPAGEVLVLGVVRPLPARMAWKSSAVDAAAARADRALVGQTRVSIGVGQALVNRDAFRMPDDGKVSDHLSPADRARFDAARARLGYPKDGLENWRPYMAATILAARAIEQAGLSDKLDVEKETLRKLAKRRIRPTSVLDFETRSLVRALNDMPAGADAVCLTDTLTLVEGKIDQVAARAHAWARGDVPALRALGEDLSAERCLAALQRGGMPMDALVEQAKADWTAALRAAAAQPGTTLAIAPMGLLLAPDGPLARLRAAGIAVEGE